MSVTVRLKVDGTAELEAHGATVEECSDQLVELRQSGAFSAVKVIAQEYRDAPAAGVESVQSIFPEARVVIEEDAAAAPTTVAAPTRTSAAPLRV